MERAGEAIADEMIKKLVQRCRTLDTFPERGMLHPELGGIRTVPLRRKATIGYIVEGDEVVIIGIAWRGQDFVTALGKA